MFLVGKGIPEHITSLPQTVLNTPFGQMLRPQLDKSMRSITQAPVPPPQPGVAAQRPANLELAAGRNGAKDAASLENLAGKVHNVTLSRELKRLLDHALNSCAIIFFTSSTCAPCALVYPAYDSLAAEAGKSAVFIKVDLNQAYEIGATYQVRATPTFMTFLKGQKQDEWSGADERKLRSNVQLLLHMAHPPHPHTQLELRRLLASSSDPVIYRKVPPLEKLITKIGAEASGDASVQAVKTFIAARSGSAPPQEAPLPNLPEFSEFLYRAISALPRESLFAAYDLLRAALVDSRVSTYFATSPASETILQLLSHVNGLGADCPYNLRLVSLQLGCNLFASAAPSRARILESAELGPQLVQLAQSGLGDRERATARIAAASLCFNIAAVNHTARSDGGREALEDNLQVELAAAIIEAMDKEEESKDVIGGLVRSLGLLVYRAPLEGELLDLCRALGAGDIVERKVAICGKDNIEAQMIAEVRKLLNKGT